MPSAGEKGPSLEAFSGRFPLVDPCSQGCETIPRSLGSESGKTCSSELSSTSQESIQFG